MTEPPITDHTFRGSGADGASSTGTQGGIRRGMCAWNGTCNRPRADHITVPDFRARKRAAGAQ